MVRLLGVFIIVMSFAPLSHAETLSHVRLIEDGQLDITIALGFDELGDGHSASVDSDEPQELDVAYRELDVLYFEREIEKCEACAFRLEKKQKGYRRYGSHVRINGRNIKVNLFFVFQEPGVRIGMMKGAFLAALKNHDVIIYAGHSRHGEGFPDFGPGARLDGKILKNVGKHKWTGFAPELLAQDRYQILALNSCKSRMHYKRVIRKGFEKNPNELGLILTNHDVYFDDFPATTMALVAGVLAQKSSASILADMEVSGELFNAFMPDQRAYSSSGF